MDKNSLKIINTIIESIKDKLGENIVDLNFKTINNSICDNFIVCHGNSDKHVQAITDNIIENVKTEYNKKPHSIEGLNNSEWVLIDYNNIIVHVFQSSIRTKYNFEQLWADAKIKTIK